MIPKHLQPKLDELAKEYGARLYSSAREVLGRDEYRNTGELVESLRVSIIPCSDNSPPEIVLEYADHGYFLNYKGPKWTRVPSLEKLRAWAETIEFSGPVPGYQNGAGSLPPWKRKERIVSAIAWNKRKRDTWIQKPWKGKRGIDLGKILRELNQSTATAWARAVENTLAEAIETGKILS